MMLDKRVHTLVYQALDQVLAHKVTSPGTARAVFTAIDLMKTNSAPLDHVRRAENIAIEIHRLQWSLQQSDKHGSQSALRKLKRLAADWIDTRMDYRHLAEQSLT